MPKPIDILSLSDLNDLSLCSSSITQANHSLGTYQAASMYLFPIEGSKDLPEDLWQAKPELSPDVEGRNELAVQSGVEQLGARVVPR